MAKKKPEAPSAPLWMVTFADLMSLLVCFFVLILSFSIVDQKRFYEVTGSLRDAFGLSTESLRRSMVPIVGSPLQENVEFIRPVIIPITRPRPLEDAQTPNTQVGDDLGPGDSNLGEAGAQIEELFTSDREPRTDLQLTDRPVAEIEQELREQRERDAVALAANQLTNALDRALRREIDLGHAEISRSGNEVIIRLTEGYSFEPGSAELTPEFTVVLDRLSLIMGEPTAEVIVAGNTDDRPLSSARYRSNWDLSAGRAVSVVEYLETIDYIDRAKLVARAYGDSRPVEPNDTPDGRAANRRIELHFKPSEALLAAARAAVGRGGQ